MCIRDRDLELFGGQAFAPFGFGQMSLADITAAAQLSVADYLGGIDWKDHEPTRDWYAAFKSRPSFGPLLTERMDVIQPPSHYAQLDD